MKKKVKLTEQLPLTGTTPVNIKPYLALSFFLPAVIMALAFALNRVYPFGGRTILCLDLYHQYYPFLSSLWFKVRESALASWSWAAGAGHDYTVFYAYYLASPLNWLALLLPHAWLREVLTLLLLVKIGCAGLFTGIFLSKTFPLKTTQNTLVLPAFSALYALCGFTLGYHVHIMWFDSFALLPLVLLGLNALINGGKYRLYVVSLALAVLANFHIGLFICIFVAISFFAQCFVKKLSLGEFARKLGKVAAYSALALGLTAVLLIPTLYALKYTPSNDSLPPAALGFTHNFFDILGNFIAFQPPTVFYGLPNLYSGLFTLMLAGLFIFSPGVSRREKIVSFVIVLFLILSANLNVLDYVWNGFNYTNIMPSRYTFLLSFLLVVMAYRVFTSTDKISRNGLTVMGLSASLFLLSAVYGSREIIAIIGSAVLCVFYLVFLFFRGKGKVWVQRFMPAAFLLVVATELTIGAWIGVETAGPTERSEYPKHYEQIQTLLDLRRPGGVDFYRTDIDVAENYNGPSLYNYNGISFFSSTINANTLWFIYGLGLMGWDKCFSYNETTPLFNAFLNMRYLITTDGPPKYNGVYWETLDTARNVFLQENNYYLPLGFMVKEGLSGYAHQVNDPLSSQNDLFSRATGLDGSLFSVTSVTGTAPELTQDVNGKIIPFWNYTTPSDGLLFVFTRNVDEALLGVFANDFFLDYIHKRERTSYISTLGSFEEGDIVTFVIMEGRNVLIRAGLFNHDLFEQGYAQLASQPLVLTEFTNTRVKGHVTALEEGLLYTSIPHNRNWSVFVNGLKSEIVLIDSAMMAVRLTEGTHEIEFRYFNRSLMAGIIISLVSLVIFAALILLKRTPYVKLFLNEEKGKTDREIAAGKGRAG